jgi:hypothetical protein
MNVLYAAAQAVEASRPGVSVFLDAGIIGLIVTNSGLLLKALIDRRAVKTALAEVKKAGASPGESETCREHGEDIATLKEFKGGAAEALKRIEGKVDRILERQGK